MGTVYGFAHLQGLFTGTFLLTFVVAPVFAGLALEIEIVCTHRAAEIGPAARAQ
jgi:hypothetical protein